MESQIRNDLKSSQLSHNETAVSTLRILISEIRNAAIAKESVDTQLSDQEIVSVVQKEIKKRREAAAGFRQGGREESALKEEAEMKVLEKYLPTQISDAELTKIIQEAITSSGASSISYMGRVIGLVMGKVGQGADGQRVSSIVKELLGGARS